MGLVSKLICEKELPIPWEDFTEEESERFSEVQWDELEFYTASFYDVDIGDFDTATYTITEDEQFYRTVTRVELSINKEGQLEQEEKGNDLEKQEFTGEINFGTEILGEETDYEISFVALIFKGNLKELNINEWKKRSSEKRKKAIAELSTRVKEEKAKRKSLWSAITRPFKKVFCFIISMIKWILFGVFKLVVNIEIWINK